MDFLKKLQIHSKNQGVTTGTVWLASKSEMIESFSPVEGNKGTLQSLEALLRNQIL